MRRSTRRKLKVYAVDAAMILLAVQVTVVLKDNSKVKASTYVPEKSIQKEYAETKEIEVPESTLEEKTASNNLKWSNKDSNILLKIAMAEAEGEGTEGKALVMRVVLNRVESKEFPDSVEGVVFQPGQFEPIQDEGRYWNVEPDSECYKALYMVQNENWDNTEGALYFCRTGCSSWMENNTEYLFAVGNHSFYR